MKINTFLIGVQKAGTSTFWNWISQHPDIYGPDIMKDFHYFTTNDWIENKGIDYLHSYYRTFHKEKVVLQGGVNYYFETEFIENHLPYQPNARYIIILRNPIERAWSAYLFFSKLGNETRSFKTALEDELNNQIHPEDRHMFAYIEHGLYAKYLKLLFAKIPRERFLVFFYEDLFENPDQSLRETFEFLGVNSAVKINTTIVKNKTGQVKYPLINKILFTKKGVIGFIKRNLPAQKLIPLKYRIKLGYAVRDLNTTKQSNKPTLDPKDREALASYFKIPNQELETLLETDLKQIWN